MQPFLFSVLAFADESIIVIASALLVSGIFLFLSPDIFRSDDRGTLLTIGY